MKNSSDVAAKWGRNLAAAGKSITDGVRAVTVNPAQTAASRANAYVAGVQAAVASGKYQRGLGRVTLQSWQDSMITKGLPRIASGATAAVPKFQSFMDKWLPHMGALPAKLAGTPRGDLETNIQRSAIAIRHAHDFKYQ